MTDPVKPHHILLREADVAVYDKDDSTHDIVKCRAGKRKVGASADDIKAAVDSATKTLGRPATVYRFTLEIAEQAAAERMPPTPSPPPEPIKGP